MSLPDALRRLVDEYLDHDAKAVFSPIRGSSSRSFGSLMENASLNFFTSGSIIAAWLLGRQPILVGKSILIERAALETFGGFGYFKDHLAEDFLLGDAFVRSGFRVADQLHLGHQRQPDGLAAEFLQADVALGQAPLPPPPARLSSRDPAQPVRPRPGRLAAFGRRGWIVLAVTAAAKIGLEYVNFLFVNAEDRRRLRNHLLFPAAVIAKDLILLRPSISPPSSAARSNGAAAGSPSARTRLIQVPANMDNLVYEGA